MNIFYCFKYNIEFSLIPDIPLEKTLRLHYEDVYSSSDSDDIPLSAIQHKFIREKLQEGLYVVVRLAGKKIVRHYIGLICSDDGNGEYMVKFMKKIGSKTFTFPEKEDFSVIYEPDVQRILNCPDFNEKKEEYVFSDVIDFPNLF